MKTGMKTHNAAARVLAALARRYKAPEFALFAQVGNGTGFTGNRYADAMAMSLWPSRGLYLYGFEIKVSRSDWLRELRDPAKAEDVASYCDFWHVVVPSDEIVELAELPAPWGLLRVSGRGVHQVRPAQPRTPPADLDRPLVAAILRRASEGMTPRSAIAEQLEHARAEGRAAAEQSAKWDGDNARTALERLRRSVDDFERASGVRISEYNGGDIGRRFAIAAGLDELRAGWGLRNARQQLEGALEAVAKLQQWAELTGGKGEGPLTGPSTGESPGTLPGKGASAGAPDPPTT